MISRLRRRFALLSVLSCAVMVPGHVPLLAMQQPGQSPSLNILGVPIGATVAEVEAMARSRGLRPQSRAQYCTSGEFCTLRANVENFAGTEFLAELNGYVRDADRQESFLFYFTGAPNETRVWSAGLDQRFGDWSRPSKAAPMANDALAAIRARFGPTTHEEGTIANMSNQGSGMTMMWYWDSNGRLIRPPALARHLWPRSAVDQWNNCSSAYAKAKTAPGHGYSSVHNLVATDPTPFVLARNGKCARAARVEFGQTRGHMHKLHIRVVDFQAGHDALFHTTRLVSERRGTANATRSATNKPDF